ncbi:MAG: 16S rRNA (uracil(1498)-N(3))-methyltransferase [Acidimicrobiia bacterium]|nr:16S rRNA (uracil(1498)-N(3))-methyltransferase [Acidimicrobiia bacterium]
MTITDLRSLPLVFVDDLDRPQLDENDHRHLSRSLRIRAGEPVALSDGRGRWRRAELGSTEEPTALGPVNRCPRPTELTVGFALVKSDRPEIIVQKLTELGIGRIIPMTTQRTAVRWDGDKVERNHGRHRRIVREAAMQSRTVWMPEVWALTPLSDVVNRFPRAALAEPGRPILGQDPLETVPIEVLVGPEGGFTEAELSDRPTVGLPGNILRTETAAIAAGVVLALTASRG